MCHTCALNFQLEPACEHPTVSYGSHLEEILTAPVGTQTNYGAVTVK